MLIEQGRVGIEMLEEPPSANAEAGAAVVGRCERGAVMIIGLFMSLGLIAFAWFVIGIGRAFLFRERGQEATDTVALFVSIIQSRGMNAIAALNIFLLALTYLFMINRLGEALLFHVAQVIGLPDNGFGNSSTIQPFEFAGKTCTQIESSFPGGGHTVTIPTTVSDTYKGGFACAAGATKRLEEYNTKTGLSLGNDIPQRVVDAHNYLRFWNIQVETAQNKLFEMIVLAQDGARTVFAQAATNSASFMLIDYDSSYFGGQLAHMTMNGGHGVEVPGLNGKLPVETNSDGPSRNDRTLNALCVRLSQPINAPTGIMFMRGESGSTFHEGRIWEPVARSNAQVINGQTFGTYFKAAVLTDYSGATGQTIWCDALRGGTAAGGANYWGDLRYAGLRDDVGGGRAQNGGEWFQARAWVASRLEDSTVTRPVGILSSGVPGDNSSRLYAQSEMYFDCNGAWTDAACNGQSSGSNVGSVGAQSQDFALFRTAWYGRLKRVDKLPGGGARPAEMIH